jgi:ribosome assembly protein YihI (activator of Der GTPase)
VEEKVVKQCDALRVQLKDDEAELLKANKKFTELFREFDAGGTYAKEKVDEVRKRLDFVIEQSGLARRDVGEDIDDLQVT